MPIFRKAGKSVLFVHVPKTGGTSVENLFAQSGWSVQMLDRGRPGTLNPHRWCSPQHMHATLLADQLRLNTFDLIFMVVRDPMARFRSEIGMRHPGLTDTWSDDLDDWTVDKLNKFPTQPYILDNHFRPQNEFYVPGSMVWKLEAGLDSLANELRQEYAIDVAVDVPRDQIARSKIRPSEIVIPKKLQGRIVDLYQMDYIRFNYDPPF